MNRYPFSGMRGRLLILIVLGMVPAGGLIYRATEKGEIRELLEAAIHHARSLTFELSPPILYELGFEAAVQSLCERIQRQYVIVVSFADDGACKPLYDDLRVLLFRGVASSW